MEQQNNKKLILIFSLMGIGFLLTIASLIVILTTSKDPACTAHYDFDCNLLCDTCGNAVDTSNPQQHRHVFSLATCTEKAKCICGATTGEVLQHEFVEANCTTPKTCATCGLEEGEKVGHNWQRNTCDQPETCTTCNATRGTGIPHMFLDGSCQVCNAVDPNYVQPHDHVYDNTCDSTCNICDNTRDAGHNWGAWQTITEPTTTSVGEALRICNDCFATEEKVLPKVITVLTPTQEDALYEKYDNGILCDNPNCNTFNMIVYDEEFGVYVEISQPRNNGLCYMYDYSYEWDGIECCLVTINDGHISSIEHCQDCQAEDAEKDLSEKLIQKYEGLFTCDDTCDGEIIIWDDEFKVYVIFDEDFWNDGMFEVEDFLDTYKNEPEITDCIGTIDMQNKTITITQHSEFRAYYNAIEDIDFVTTGATDDCFIAIEYKDTGVYILFTGSNGIYSAYGTGSVSGGAEMHCCSGEIDIENATLKIISHKH